MTAAGTTVTGPSVLRPAGGVAGVPVASNACQSSRPSAYSAASSVMPSGELVPNAYSRRSGIQAAGAPEPVTTSASAHATHACAAAVTAAESAAGMAGRGGQRRRRRAQRRSEVAVELLAVDGAAGHHGQEAPAGRIPRVGRRRDRIGGAIPGHVLAEVARGEQALEVLSGADAHPRGGRGVDVVGLYRRLQRHRGGRVVAEPWRRRGPAWPQLVQQRNRSRDLREDRAAAVARGELAELPLAPEQPQRVVDARLQTRRELRIARAGLEPRPACRLAGHQPEAGRGNPPEVGGHGVRRRCGSQVDRRQVLPELQRRRPGRRRPGRDGAQRLPVDQPQPRQVERLQHRRLERGEAPDVRLGRAGRRAGSPAARGRRAGRRGS